MRLINDIAKNPISAILSPSTKVRELLPQETAGYKIMQNISRINDGTLDFHLKDRLTEFSLLRHDNARRKVNSPIK